MSFVQRTIQAIAEIAPILTLALLLVLPFTLVNRTTFDPGVSVRMAAAAAAMESVPYTLGSWIGRDIPVPQAAHALLKPNAILSRRYDHIASNIAANVLVVHCTDIRDMTGHYPPICYPSAGWVAEGAPRGVPAAIQLDSRTIPVRKYHFSRTLDRGRTVGIRIYNFFIMPDGSISTEMDELYANAGRMAVATQGAAQFQVITFSDLSEIEAEQVAADLLGRLEDVLLSLGVGGNERE